MKRRKHTMKNTEIKDLRWKLYILQKKKKRVEIIFNSIN